MFKKEEGKVWGGEGGGEGGEEAGERLPSNGHYFSTVYPFAEIFDLLDSQQSKEKNMV